MTDTLTAAEADRDRSRERFRSSVAAVRSRLDPARLRAEGSDRAREAISAVPTQIADAAKARPVLAAGIVSSLALLLFRKPILGALRRMTQEKDNG